METTEKITLIDGNYSPSEAKEILMNLFNNKIDYHTVKNFSSLERFGKEDQTALRRLPELKETVALISQIINDATSQNKNIIVKSTVDISFSNSGE